MAQMQGAGESKNRVKTPKRAVNGILLLDKPLGLSSNQALQQAKRLFSAAKAGHTGSLDPLATGLLPICFGEATKISGYLLDADKRYLARARIGSKTATGDAEGAVTARSDPSHLTREEFEHAAQKFLGATQQIPPMYSALKREGQPLYKLARQGLEVERAARPITVRTLRLTAFTQSECELDIECSKGTYIRTLVEDIAAAAGQVAHLLALRRLEAGSFRAPRMWSLEQLETLSQQGQVQLDACLINPAVALAHWPQMTLDADQAFHLSRGQAVRVTGELPEGPLALLDEVGGLLGIGEMDANGVLTPRRWMGGSG